MYKYDPEISVRASTADYKKEDWLVNLPLYAVEKVRKLDYKIRLREKNILVLIVGGSLYWSHKAGQ